MWVPLILYILIALFLIISLKKRQKAIENFVNFVIAYEPQVDRCCDIDKDIGNIHEEILRNETDIKPKLKRSVTRGLRILA